MNPLLPNAVFGQPYAVRIGPAPDADPTPTVDVTLLISRANDPETQIRARAWKRSTSSSVGGKPTSRFFTFTP